MADGFVRKGEKTSESLIRIINDFHNIVDGYIIKQLYHSLSSDIQYMADNLSSCMRENYFGKLKGKQTRTKIEQGIVITSKFSKKMKFA